MSYKSLYIVIVLLFLSKALSAQEIVKDSAIYKTIEKVNANNLNPDNLKDASLLYKNGSIYLVVLVLLTIFAGIIFYLIRLDKKITQLENQNK